MDTGMQLRSGVGAVREDRANLIPGCQSGPEGWETKECEQSHLEGALLIQQMSGNVFQTLHECFEGGGRLGRSGAGSCRA